MSKTDAMMNIQQAKDLVEEFVKEREWEQFHLPKKLSMDIAIETVELMEKFVWVDNKNSIDLSAAFFKKLAVTKQNYPIDKVKGRSDKYTTYKK